MSKGQKGFDTPESTLNHAHDILNAGYAFVIRYISPNTPTFPTKRLTLTESNNLASVGLKRGAVWESGYPTSSGYFSAAQGKADGIAAASVMQGLNAPKGTAIYFAVDYDASAGDMEGHILPYAFAFQIAVKAQGYLVGVYGSQYVCKTLHDKGIAHYTWVAQSGGWGHAPITPDIQQGPSTKIVGLDADTDVLTSDAAGLW